MLVVVVSVFLFLIALVSLAVAINTVMDLVNFLKQTGTE